MDSLNADIPSDEMVRQKGWDRWCQQLEVPIGELLPDQPAPLLKSDRRPAIQRVDPALPPPRLTTNRMECLPRLAFGG